MAWAYDQKDTKYKLIDTFTCIVLDIYFVILQTKQYEEMRNIHLLALLLWLPFTVKAAERTAGINVDSRVKYQHVSGFGGFSPSPQWAYWLNDTQMNTLFGKADSQLGLNIVRLYIANNKSGWSASVANAKAAKRNGAFIFASPWSPPAEWKSNGSDSNGGELLEEHYADWANFLNDYYKYMKGQGVTIDAVSIQNEPDWNASYQSCIWTGEKMAKFIREYGHLIECKIIAPEAIHFSKNIHEPILNDPEACNRLDIVGGHFYGWDGSSYPLAAEKGKEVWMTEYLINERQEQNGIDINWKDDGFLFARSVNDAMLANMSAWVHYSLKRYYGCLGDGKYGTKDNVITKRGYILSQYAKYVSGNTRIKHSVTDDTGKLTASAYISDNGETVTVMIINPSADNYTTTLTLPFYTLQGKKIVTTENKNAQKSDISTDGETYNPQVDIEAYSVNTFVFTKSGDRTDLPETGEDSGTLIFPDRFASYGASCIPEGWRSKSEEGYREAGNYSLGPRIMGFSAEGDMQYAFYFRTGSSAFGYVSYGEKTGHRLTLKPGKYTLAYSVVGWKTTPAVKAAIQTASAKSIKTLDSKPENFISANGSSVRITNSTEYSLDFEIETEGNYLLKWIMPASNSGYNEALLGNVRLMYHGDGAGIGQTVTDSNDSQIVKIYNMQGQRVPQLQNGINIVVRANGSVTKILKERR